MAVKGQIDGVCRVMHAGNDCVWMQPGGSLAPVILVDQKILHEAAVVPVAVALAPVVNVGPVLREQVACRVKVRTTLVDPTGAEAEQLAPASAGNTVLSWMPQAQISLPAHSCYSHYDSLQQQQSRGPTSTTAHEEGGNSRSSR